MNDNHKELTDEDRERILRLVLIEAGGGNVEEELQRFPSGVRSLFRKVVVQAGLVNVKELKEKGMENHFVEPKLSGKGARRLKELNGKFGDTQQP